MTCEEKLFVEAKQRLDVLYPKHINSSTNNWGMDLDSNLPMMFETLIYSEKVYDL